MRISPHHFFEVSYVDGCHGDNGLCGSTVYGDLAAGDHLGLFGWLPYTLGHGLRQAELGLLILLLPDLTRLLFSCKWKSYKVSILCYISFNLNRFYVVSIRWNRLGETIPTNAHNIGIG